MKYRWYVIGAAIAALLAAILLLCGRWAPDNDASRGDLRIVSLSPNMTEMLFALNLQGSIVGVSNRCDYPPEAKNIESVGGFGVPSIEKLLSLKPDLIITADFERADDAKILRKSGIEVLELKINNFQEMFGAMREIGRATKKLRQAEEIITAMQKELEAVTRQYSGIVHEQLPRVFVELWYDPITTTGATSFIDELITRAGGINVAGEINQTYPHINPEKVIEWNPDVIVLCYMAQESHQASQISSRIGWAEISAVKNGRIIDDIPGDCILRPGPRLVEGVKALAQRLHETTTEDTGGRHEARGTRHE